MQVACFATLVLAIMALLPAVATGAPPQAAAGPADIEWLNIPKGKFDMGCTPGDTDCPGDEFPRHRVKVKKFQIAANETTNAQYKACVKAGGRRMASSRSRDHSRYEGTECCSCTDAMRTSGLQRDR